MTRLVILLVKSFLKTHSIAFVIANLCAVLIGAISTVVFSLVGPALQVLVSPPNELSISFASLLGERWAVLLTAVFARDAITIDHLWNFLPIFLISLSFLRASLLVAQWWIWEAVSETYVAALRSRLVDKFLNLSPFARRSLLKEDEQVSTVISNDIRMFREYLIHFFGGLPRELLQVFFYTISLLMLSPWLFVVFIFGLSPAVVALNRLGKKIRKRSGVALDQYSGLAEWLQQRLLGIETIKHYRMELFEAERMNELTDKMTKSFFRTVRAKVRSGPILEFIAIFSLVLVLYVSFQMVASGLVTGSVLISFFAVLAILAQSASKLGRYFSANREGVAALSRIESFEKTLSQHQQSDIQSFAFYPAADKVLTLDNISVSYQKSGSPALKEFSYSFKGSKVYCICGPSGAGKSTLMQYILGMLPSQHGRMLISESCRHDNISGELIGYMPQSVRLAPVSIFENIAYPQEIVDEKKARQALKKAGFSAQFIEDFSPKGAKEFSSLELSGGQAQRVMIARLFYHNFPIILIDEGTSALDPKTEAIVYQGIENLARNGAAVLMIAHRLSALDIADEVLLLENGRLKAHDHPDQIRVSKAFQDFVTLNR